MLARLEALEASEQLHAAEIAARDRAIAERDARIAELEAEVARLGRDLIDAEALNLHAQRRRVADSKPVSSAMPTTPEARRAEADRLLAEGVERYRAGDKTGATTCFERGLVLVPDHAALQRALRRYT